MTAKIPDRLAWLFAGQAVLLAVAAWRNAHQLNPDAVAYCRIAGYYAAGQWELAVSGYWGPLLSWLMVPLVKLGLAPLAAARVVMAASGVVFLAGTVGVFRAFRLPPRALLAGAGIAAAWSVFWSVRNISPDLLMAGLAGLAIAATLEALLVPVAATPSSQRRAIAAGMWWGVAYLAKAVALPWAVLATAGFALFAAAGRAELRRAVAARLGVIWLCLALVAGPWIAALSLHYGKFTFSTTGPIAHALAGPGEEARYHPAMVTLHEPDIGRVTQWEEPSRMGYRFWSPFEGPLAWQHQLRVVQSNAGIMMGWLLPADAWLAGGELPAWRRWLGTFDLVGLAAVALGITGLALIRHLGGLRRVRLLWAWVPVGALAGLYLPFFVMAEDNRYFYPLWPCLWLLTVAARPKSAGTDTMGHRRWGFCVMVISFALPAVLWCGAALRGLPNPAATTARELAAAFRAEGVAGPFAGSAALPGGRTGLYTAFLRDGRWLGDEPLADPAAYARAGARVVFVRAGTRQFAAFAFASEWHEWRSGAPPVGQPGEDIPPGREARVFLRKIP